MRYPQYIDLTGKTKKEKAPQERKEVNQTGTQYYGRKEMKKVVIERMGKQTEGLGAFNKMSVSDSD